MKKTQEEREMDAIIKAQAANASAWQKQATAGAEMRKWVEDGHWTFIQTRILNPLEVECFKKIKSIRLGSSAIANVAEVKGTLKVFDMISARIDNAIQTGQDALDKLKDLEMQNSTQEGE